MHIHDGRPNRGKTQPVVEGKEVLKQMMRSGTCGRPAMEVVGRLPTVRLASRRNIWQQLSLSTHIKSTLAGSLFGGRERPFGGWGRSLPAADSYAESSGSGAPRDAAPSC